MSHLHFVILEKENVLDEDGNKKGTYGNNEAHWETSDPTQVYFFTSKADAHTFRLNHLKLLPKKLVSEVHELAFMTKKESPKFKPEFVAGSLNRMQSSMYYKELADKREIFK